MLRAFLLLSVLLIGCAGTKNGAIEKAGNDKNVFFSMSKKEGFDYLKLMQLTLRKIDSVNEGSSGKVYIFHYREQQ